MTNEDVKNYIISWNLRFPVDRWWRKKFTIAFNSLDHRESSFLDQLIEYEEEKFFEEIIHQEEYKPGTGDWLKQQDAKTVEESIEQLKDEFKDLE